MDPITAGAIALLTLLGNKLIDWSTEKALDKASEKVMQLLNEKSPSTARALEVVKEKAALPLAEREDFGEAVLVEEVKKVAQADPEIKAAVEALGNYTNEVAKENLELDKVLKEKQSSYQNTMTNQGEKIYGNIQGSNVQSLTQNFN